jgi:hypothetical protein
MQHSDPAHRSVVVVAVGAVCGVLRRLVVTMMMMEVVVMLLLLPALISTHAQCQTRSGSRLCPSSDMDWLVRLLLTRNSHCGTMLQSLVLCKSMSAPCRCCRGRQSAMERHAD